MGSNPTGVVFNAAAVRGGKSCSCGSAAATAKVGWGAASEVTVVEWCRGGAAGPRAVNWRRAMFHGTWWWFYQRGG